MLTKLLGWFHTLPQRKSFVLVWGVGLGGGLFVLNLWYFFTAHNSLRFVNLAGALMCCVTWYFCRLWFRTCKRW